MPMEPGPTDPFPGPVRCGGTWAFGAVLAIWPAGLGRWGSVWVPLWVQTAEGLGKLPEECSGRRLFPVFRSCPGAKRVDRSRVVGRVTLNEKGAPGVPEPWKQARGCGFTVWGPWALECGIACRLLPTEAKPGRLEAPQIPAQSLVYEWESWLSAGGTSGYSPHALGSSDSHPL